MGEFSLTKEERISRKKEFDELFGKGKRQSTRNFQIISHPNQLGIRRLGLGVGRKVGKAVKRNRVKRLLREFFRLNKTRLPSSHDYLFVAKPGSADLTYKETYEELKILLNGQSS
jgi:ribonuclease P protein component